MARFIKENSTQRKNAFKYETIVLGCIAIILALLVIFLIQIKSKHHYVDSPSTAVDTVVEHTAVEEYKEPPTPIEEETKEVKVNTLSLQKIIKAILLDLDDPLFSCNSLLDALEDNGFKKTDIDRNSYFNDTYGYSIVCVKGCSAKSYPKGGSNFDLSSDFLAVPHNSSSYIADIIVTGDGTMMGFNLYSYGEANLQNWLSELKVIGFKIEDYAVFEQTKQWELISGDGISLTLSKTGDEYGTNVLTYHINV